MKLKHICYILLLFLSIYILFGFTHNLEVTHYEYASSKIPASFDGYRIAFLSDLHCKNFGKNNATLISKIRDMQPDIIVFTGDTVDEIHEDLSSLEALFQGIQDIAPVYSVTGNHEFTKEGEETIQYKKLQDLYAAYNITDLDDKTVDLTRDDSVIKLVGQKWRSKYIVQYIEPANTEYFNILLYHGSDFFDLIAPYDYDLVLSGHIHGGIIRLPFLGGLLGNTGEFFPKYNSGIYQNGLSTLISSRGLGDASIPRFNNRPELICITLKHP